MEHLIFGKNASDSSSTCLALYIDQANGKVAAAFTDNCLDPRIGVLEFPDDSSLSNFESLCVQIGVKEIVTVESLKNDKHIGYISARSGIVHTTVKRSDFGTQNLSQDMEILCGGSFNLPLDEAPLAKGCLSALLRYLDLLSDPTNHEKYTVFKYDLTQYLKLDSTAIVALNLFPAANASASSYVKKSSLYGVLNVCLVVARLTSVSGMQNHARLPPFSEMDQAAADFKTANQCQTRCCGYAGSSR